MTTTQHFQDQMQSQAFKLASPIILALKECDDEIREVAFELFEQLASGELDKEQEESTLALIAEMLFPNGDGEGAPGLDLQEAEAIARRDNPEAESLLAKMDREESTFAEKLQKLLNERNMTQAELAEKIGVGQPAISMMLKRECRPQKKTLGKLASALGVETADLWPI